MVYSNVSGTFDLAIDPTWRNVQTDEVRILCDTSGAPVIINLPQISALNGAWGVKIYVTDNTGNASTNNIIVNAFAGDEIDGSGSTTYVIDNDGSTVMLAIASLTQWVGTEGAGGGSGSPVIWFSKTYAQMVALQIASGFITGAFYWISDRKIWIQAIDTSLLAHSGNYVHDTLVPVIVSEITYDLSLDLVLSLKDINGNYLMFDASFLFNFGLANDYILTRFPYGNSGFTNNTIINSYMEFSVDGLVFYGGSFRGNTVTNESNFYGLYNKTGAGNQIIGCTFDKSVVDVGFDDNVGNMALTFSTLRSAQFTFYGIDGCYVTACQFSSCIVNSPDANCYVNLNKVVATTDAEIHLYNGGVVTRTAQMLDCVIDNSTVAITATNRNSVITYLNASGDSDVTISDVASTNGALVSGGSLLLLTNLTRNPSGLSVTENSSLTITNRTTTGSNMTIYVSGSSVVSISGGTGTISDWFVDDNASVTLTNNSTTKTNLKIYSWTVTLDPAQAHTQGMLFIDDDSGFTPSYASNILVFYDYTTKVSGNYFIVDPSTVDSYVGIIFFYNCSINIGAPSLFQGFLTPSVLLDNIVFYIQVATGQYLQIVQDPQPIASGAIGMPVSLTLYGGVDANTPSDTIKIQKNIQDRFYQLDAWSIG